MNDLRGFHWDALLLYCKPLGVVIYQNQQGSIGYQLSFRINLRAAYLCRRKRLLLLTATVTVGPNRCNGIGMASFCTFFIRNSENKNGMAINTSMPLGSGQVPDLLSPRLTSETILPSALKNKYIRFFAGYQSRWVYALCRRDEIAFRTEDFPVKRDFCYQNYGRNAFLQGDMSYFRGSDFRWTTRAPFLLPQPCSGP